MNRCWQLLTYLTSPILVLKYNKSQKNSILKAVQIIFSRKNFLVEWRKNRANFIKSSIFLMDKSKEYNNSILTALFMIKINNQL